MNPGVSASRCAADSSHAPSLPSSASRAPALRADEQPRWTAGCVGLRGVAGRVRLPLGAGVCLAVAHGCGAGSRAGACGRTGGRSAVVTSRKLAAALAMRDQGDVTMTEIAGELGVSLASLSFMRQAVATAWAGRSR
jgi:hypothetical protein